jgi:cytochrome c oxidase assembly protein subunit 15
MDPRSSDVPHSRLAHRLAWFLACVTFPLIWVGGSVTTYHAGMAVPDWPNTFGYNLFLYPLESWLRVWDVFLEHSHRLIAATAGMVTIALALTLWLVDGRRWVRRLGGLALLGVCLQGTLGGLRVTASAILLANVHGCTAPLFFALTTTLVAVTAPAWRQPRAAASRLGLQSFRRLALATTWGVYLQIVLGAQLRHPDPRMAPGWFTLWVWFHVIGAGLLTAAVIGLVRTAARRLPDQPMLVRRSRWLGGLFFVQLALGAAAWVTHYNWPLWFVDYVCRIDYTVVTGGRLQAVLTTAHVAAGSLTLVTALSLAIWSMRLAGLAGDSLLPDRASAREPSMPPLDRRAESRSRLASLREYGQLIRPRILAMVLLTMAVAALTAGRPVPPWPELARALLGSAVLIAGAIALNQRLEYRSDAKMTRTAQRPLPSGRLSVRQATWLGLAASVAGLAYLGLTAPATMVILGLVSWIVYVRVYTPMKLRSAWQTPVGALAGALPTLMGAAAAGATWSPAALAFFGIVYFWQFPHAMAIAWLRRDDFAAAELRVASVVDPTGRTAAAISLVGAVLLVPISLAPFWAGLTGWGYALAASMLGLGYLACSAAFFVRTNQGTARVLLGASLGYLPAICAALLLGILG